MTLTQFVTYCQRRHNAESDGFFGTEEILGMATARTLEILGIIGLVEGTDQSISTVANTLAYNLPTDYEFIKSVLYDGKPLTFIDFDQANEDRLQGGSTLFNVGTPEKWTVWSRQIWLLPIPAAVKTVTVYGEKKQSVMTATGDTWNLPEILHYRAADGVIGDMFDKDKAHNIAQKYESKWVNVHIPAFYEYKAKYRRRPGGVIVKDADTRTW